MECLLKCRLFIFPLPDSLQAFSANRDNGRLLGCRSLAECSRRHRFSDTMVQKWKRFEIIPHLDYFSSPCVHFVLLLLCWQMAWMTPPSAGKSSRSACAHQFLTESPRAAGEWSEAHKQVRLKAVQTKNRAKLHDFVRAPIWPVYTLVPRGAAWFKLFLKKQRQLNKTTTTTRTDAFHSVLLTYCQFE